jgi:hypothetical protein
MHAETKRLNNPVITCAGLDITRYSCSVLLGLAS